MTMNSLIKCNNLIANVPSVDFSGEGLDLEVASGQIIVLTGAENMGKDDWLKTIGGLYYPVSGSLNFFGKNAAELNHDERSQLRKKLAYVTSELNLLSVINGLANVMLPAIYHKIGDIEKIKSKALNLISKLGIDDDLEQLPADMQKDQRYLLLVVRSLMLNPSILFLEKPFCQLDTISTEHFKSFLNHRVKQDNLTIIMSTQDINFIREYADQVLFITLEKILSFTDVDDFFNSNNTQITNFLGETHIL